MLVSGGAFYVMEAFDPDGFFDLVEQQRITATLIVLGIGYVFAMIQIYETHSGLDGKPGLSAADIAIAYSGNKTATKLESALSGPMSGMLPSNESAIIIAWLHNGLDKAEYDAHIKPIIEQRCLSCHGGAQNAAQAAALRPAPMARITVAPPVTMSPPAKTPAPSVPVTGVEAPRSKMLGMKGRNFSCRSRARAACTWVAGGG